MKLDLSKEYKSYYTAKSKPELVMIERAQFLSLQGKGDPSSKEFAAVIEALYSTAYTIKFACKAQDKDFVVARLEGLWWFDEEKYAGTGMAGTPQQIPRSEWSYKLMIRMPEFVDKQAVQQAVDAVVAKKGVVLAKQITLYTMHEGKVVQMMHIGPFDKEPETLAQIMDFCVANNLQRNGLHHEIYLSDFRKTAPEKLRTILREPVK